MFQKMLQGGSGSSTPTDSVLLAQGRLEKGKIYTVTLNEDIDDFYIDFICHTVSPSYGLFHVTSSGRELIDGKDFISSGQMAYSKSGKTITLYQEFTSNNAFFVLLKYI